MFATLKTGALASFFTAALLAGCNSGTKTVTVGGKTPPPPPPAVAPKPAGNFDTTCTYLLGDNPPSSYRFAADVTAHNTGNVGIVVRLTANWDQIGGSPVVAVKRARVPIHGSRLIHFFLPASADQIDRHQSAGGKCRVVGKILSTFGPAR